MKLYIVYWERHDMFEHGTMIVRARDKDAAMSRCRDRLADSLCSERLKRVGLGARELTTDGPEAILLSITEDA